MAIILALSKLFDDVVQLFQDEASPPGSEPPQVFGWREPAKRTGKMRIVWVPGDDGDVGELAPPRYPGRNPRPLGTLKELFTVYLEGHDATNGENERAQYIAARLLFDAWWRAAYLSAHGTVTVKKVEWVDQRKERRYGATLRVVAVIDAMVPDAPNLVTAAETGVDVEVDELSVAETFSIMAPARVATTAAITLTGLQTIDGVELLEGDRVLVKDQAAGETNGIYVAGAGAWARATDADTSLEVPSGLLVFVAEGDTNGNADWVLTTAAPIVLGTTPLSFGRVTT